MDRPQGILITDIGTVHFVLTSPTHVYLTTPNTTGIEIRGVLYDASYHLNLEGDKWEVDPTTSAYKLTRKDHKEPSHSARKKADEALISAWAAHIHTYPELAHQADVHWTEEKIERIGYSLEALRKKVADEEKDLREAEERLAELMSEG